MKERVHKLLAQANLGSRRDAEVLIEQGRVRVNGEVIKLGDKADPETDVIEVDGTRIKFDDQRKLYIALFKPKQVLSTHNPFSDDERQTIYDLVPIRRTRLFSIGRLDADSEGLIVLTNDGEMAQKLTHPKFRHTKTYRVVVAGLPTAETISRWERGIELEDGVTAPCVVKITKGGDRETVLRVIMTEGKKRQIRRVASTLGHPVLRLTRVAIGSLTVEDLKPGEWRELTAAEVKALQVPSPEGRELRRGTPPRRHDSPSEEDVPAWRRARPEIDAARRRPRRARPEGDRPPRRDDERGGGSRYRGDRPPRRESDERSRFRRDDERRDYQGASDRPRRFRRDDEQGGDRPPRRDYQGASDRPRRPRPEGQGERYRGDRPPRREGDERPRFRRNDEREDYQGASDRPRRFRRDDEQGGDRPPRRDYQGASDRPRRPRPEGQGERYRGDRPPRREGEGGDRPRRPRAEGQGERYRGDRPPRREGDSENRPRRARRDDDQSNRPRRPRAESGNRPSGGTDRPPRRRKRSDESDNHEE